MAAFEFDPADYRAPHCNEQVLHAPGECEFCDKYPERQQARIASNTPFSPTDQPWPGNRPEGYRDFYVPAAPVAYHMTWDIEIEKHARKPGHTHDPEFFWALFDPTGNLAKSGWAKTKNRAYAAALLARAYMGLKRRG